MFSGDSGPRAQGAGIPAGSPPEATFNELATLAATLCRTSHALVLLLEPDGRWYRVSGLERAGEPLISSALCTLIGTSATPLVIEDTCADDRLLADRALNLAGLPPFLAGVAIRREEGEVAGVLVVTDRAPRTLTIEQEHGLTLLARQVARYLQLLEYQRTSGTLPRQYSAPLPESPPAQQQHTSEAIFRAFMNAGPFLGFLKDAAGRLLFYNRSYARLFSIGESTWLGRTDDRHWHHNPATDRPTDAEVVSGGDMVATEERLTGPDGVVTHWKMFRFPCRDSDGNLLLAGLAMDVSDDTERKLALERYQKEMQEANEQLRRLSVTDDLTGLHNRRAFEERLLMEFSIARRRRRELAVLLLDVDNFKGINDRWGHPAGDAVLRRLAAILRTTLRVPDLAARYGGEEFIVLLPESGVEAGRGFAKRLMSRMEAEPWEHAPVTVSIGLAVMSDTLFNGFQLVGMADQALYAAKHQGKNRVVTYGEHAARAAQQTG